MTKISSKKSRKFNHDPETEFSTEIHSEDDPKFSDFSDSDDLDTDTNGSRSQQRANKRFITERLNRTIFVGNLPSNISRRKLNKLFSSVLKTDSACIESGCSVESVRLRGVVPISGGNSKMARKRAFIQGEVTAAISKSLLAYVVLTSKVGISAALSLNGTYVEGDLPVVTVEGSDESSDTATGRYIRVDKAQRRNPTDNPRCCVFLGNLPFDSVEDEVRQSLSAFGSVASTRLIRDKQTGAVKGFGYVQFADEAAVPLAIRGSQTVSVRNRPVRISAWQQPGTGKTRQRQQPIKPIVKVKGQKRDNPDQPEAKRLKLKPIRKIKNQGKVKGVVLPSNLRGSQRQQFLRNRLIKNKKKKRQQQAEQKGGYSKQQRSGK